MRQRNCWRAAVVAAATAIAAPAGSAFQAGRDRPAAPAAGTASLTGVVFLAVDGQRRPVRRAKVSLRRAEGEGPAVSTDTGVDGRYRFTSLPAGRFRVVVERPGFVLFARAPGRFGARPPAVLLAAFEETTFDIQMQRGAAIEGRLLDADGQPVENIVVAAMRRAYGSRGQMLVAARHALTDDLGRFRLHTLPAGEYLVEAAPNPRAMLSQRPPAGPRPPGVARTYFPGTPRVSEAQVVSVAPGQEASGTDFTMTRVPLAVVAGRVTLASGAAPETFTARLRPIDAPVASVAGLQDGPATSNRFRFPSAPPGEYWLIATATRGPDAGLEFSAMRVTVDGRDQPDVVVRTSPGVRVSGHVEVVPASGTLPQGLRVVAEDVELDLPAPRGVPPTVLDEVATAEVDAGGSFTLENVFGPRRLRVGRLPEGWALQEVWVDGADVIDAAVDLQTASSPERVRIVITSRTAHVSGHVTDAAGRPAPRARVVVFAADSVRWGAGSRFVYTAETDESGQFDIRGVPPGRYRAVAVEYLEPGVWLDPGVLGELWPAAVPVELAAGETLPLALRRR